MTLPFRDQPGAHERHLRRRYANPLFGEGGQEVALETLVAAQSRDDDEVREFMERFRAQVEQAMELQPNVESEVILELKAGLDHSFVHCRSLTGEMDELLGAIKKLLEVTMNAVWNGAAGDPQARQELEQEELARQTNYELLEHALVADLMRPDSPIAPHELVATLLSETKPALRAALWLFEGEQLATICREGRELLTRLQQEGHALPEAWENLEIMEAVLLNQASAEEAN